MNTNRSRLQGLSILALLAALTLPSSAWAQTAWEQLTAAAGEGAAPVVPAGKLSPAPAATQMNPAAKFVRQRQKSLYGRVVESAVQVARPDGFGSGTVIDLEGHILTNAHVVGDASTVKVYFFAMQDDGSVEKVNVLEGAVIGRDTEMDIAVVKVATGTQVMKPIPFGDSDQLMVNQKVNALGCPHGIQQSFSDGTISALGKPLNGYKFINTDAAINPGNSGGALLDKKGRQIGVNSNITTKGGGFEGIGWAIPINRAKRAIAQIIKDGKVTHGVVGLEFKEIEEPVKCALTGCGYTGAFGALVTNVVAGKPAAKAGLKVGDVLQKIGKKVIAEMTDIPVVVNEAAPGDEIVFEVFRGGKTFPVKVTVENRDGSAAKPATAPAPENKKTGAETRPTTGAA